ncbi:MAG: N-acetylmuramoyl-L-alanine amidase [Granulosicoccus sp.]
MGTKLARSFSAVAIAIALYLTQPMNPTGNQSGSVVIPTYTDNKQAKPVSGEALAHSSIFPALVTHQLPIANFADIAAEVSIQDKSAKPYTPGQQNSTDPESILEDSFKSVHQPAENAILPSTDVDRVMARRSHVDVAFLKIASPKDTGRNTSSMTNLVVGLPSVKTWRTAQVKTKADELPGDLPAKKSAHLTRVSTAYQELQGFRSLLSPTAFRRSAWQDMSFNMDPKAKKTHTKPFVVSIDPGHGGTDPGSRGYNGLLEKDLTLDIAQRVKLFLSEVDDIDVQLTRQRDYGLSRQQRVDAINSSEADMVISLHFNHLPQTDVNLVESFYASRKNIKRSLSAQHKAKGELRRANSTDVDVEIDFTEGSARLARTIQQHIYSEVSFDSKNVQNAGVKQQAFFVLTRSFTPAALIEISCLSHAGEADRLVSDDYRNRLAAAIVDGIRNYRDSIQRAPLNTRDSLGA